MAKTHTSDVNVIFNNSDGANFKNKVDEYVNYEREKTYISLLSVKNTFLARYSEYLKDASDIILESINSTREMMDEKKQNGRNPSPEFKQRSFEIKLHKGIEHSEFKTKDKFEYFLRQVFDKELNYDALIEDNVIDELTNSHISANMIAMRKWSEFVSNFSYKEPRFNNEKLGAWETTIKKARRDSDIFNDVDDEDIYIATEFITYLEERRDKSTLYSFDKDFVNSMTSFLKDFDKRNSKAIYLKDYNF